MKQKVRLFGALFISLLTLQSQVSKKKSQEELNNILGGNEAKAINAQVFVTDVIVQGSICVGFDCVSGESFGSDTERLKENNLRIHFNDTSNSGSFPTNDWRIVANESTNGGDNFLAFEDSDAGTYPFKVQSGAGNNALFIERGRGDIGFGTSNPVVELHTVDGDSPTLRLEQDGSSGFTAQTWDLAGNETNFFVRDVTNGSKLPFKIRPGAPDNSLYVDTDGDLGFGTASPKGPLHVKRGSDTLLLVDNDGKLFVDDSLILTKKGIVFPDGSVQTVAFGGSNGAYTDLDVTGTAHFRGNVYVKGSIFPSASFSPSDERLKEGMKNLKNASALLVQMFPKSYYFKQEFVKELGLSAELQYGLLAQDIEKLLPQLIEEFETQSGKKYKGVNYTSIIPILIQGFKEQHQIIEDQNNRIEALENQVSSYATLEKRLKVLETASKSSTISNAKR